ncbi:MobV family relaxase [Desulfovibrio sp. ZJ369]|uniref:MobV family relaxase n=1 Tax=Desulfovibrio sp. ZJ369 TaxID=2709793 RepID=UPI0013EACB9D|nr:MobV family relaxase [Desulfovibrio sp. ZJ369]
MSYLVLHMDKFKKDAIRGIQSHNRRERESHSNPDIDYSRSVGNYDLHESVSANYAQAVQNRIDDLFLVKAVRKDAVHMCGLIVSSDTSFFTRIGKDETRRFFEEAAAYLTDFVGRENVISAMVHTDEKTPHMHFLHVPVTPDGRLSANSIYTRASLKKLQTDLPIYLQSRGFAIQRGVEQKPGAAKKHLDTREFKQQQEALNRLIRESEELAQNSRQILAALGQREGELKKSISEYEQQAEEAEKILQEECSLPKANVFNYQSVLQKASALIAEQNKALAVKHITQTRMENLQREAEALRQKQTRLEREYAAHRKHSHEEKESLESQLEKADAIMAGFLEFLRLPEIRPLHLDFLNRKRADLLQRQSERQEAEARQQSEREQQIRQEPEAVPQRRRPRMR